MSLDRGAYAAIAAIVAALAIFGYILREDYLRSEECKQLGGFYYNSQCMRANMIRLH